MAKKKKITKNEKSFRVELLTQLITLTTSGFGLVAALAWNQTIQTFVKDFIVPKIPGSALLSQFVSAILVTVFAVLVTYQLSRIASHIQSKR